MSVLGIAGTSVTIPDDTCFALHSRRQDQIPANKRWQGALVCLIWSLASCFYLYEFFIRVTPDAVLPQVSSAISIPDTDLVTALSAYLWVYAPMQLVVGLLIDRFGSRFPLAVASIACGIGSLLFASATSGVDLGMGRGLQGFGSAFAFVGAIYVATVWCSPKRLALIVGLTTSVGMIGAIAGQAPVAAIASEFGWQTVVRWGGLIGIGLGVVLLVFIPSRPAWFHDRVGPEPHRSVLKDLWKVGLNWKVWLVGCISAIVYLPQSVFAAMWGTTYLERSLGSSVTQAAMLVSILPFTWLFACPIVGWLSDRLGLRKRLLLIGCFINSGLIICLVNPNIKEHFPTELTKHFKVPIHDYQPFHTLTRASRFN